MTTSNYQHVNELMPPQDSPGDWTAAAEPPGLTPFQRFARGHDWANSALGPMDQWGVDLRRSMNVLMTDPRPASLLWGPNNVFIYNEYYTPILGHRHPRCFGTTFQDTYPHLTEFIRLLEMVRTTGQPIAGSAEKSQFFLEREGWLEESYFSWSLIPLQGPNGIAGIYNPSIDMTSFVVSQRRTALLIKLGDVTSKNLAEFWRETARSLAHGVMDIPFAATYTSDEGYYTPTSSESSHISFATPKNITLMSIVGLLRDEAAARKIFEATTENEILLAHLNQAAETHDVVYVDAKTFPLLNTIICRPHRDQCREAVIIPVRPTTRQHVGGFVLIGLNPRRPWDEDHKTFVRLLNRLLDTSMASAVLVEEEIRRSETAAKRAAVEQARLEEQLRLTHSKNRRLEMQFPAFANRALIGIAMYTAQGEIIFANDEYYKILGLTKGEDAPMAFMNFVAEDELPRAHKAFEHVIVEKANLMIEIRFKKRWIPPGQPLDGSGETTDTTVLVSAYPEMQEDGSVDALVSCLMDISQQKWAEGLQKKRTEEALASKRLQEAFIDMTSHEMRNPLGAVIHCCDDIIMSLEDKANDDGPVATKDDVANALDAAKTILHCSIHQKRIVDDILTLSKLDSDLLPISPVNVKLVDVVQETLQMFQVELKNAEIDIEMEAEPSIKRLQIDRVWVDPSRLTQVFINLLTNAIKFTQTEKTRRIKIRIGAAKKPPTKDKKSGAIFIKPQQDLISGTYTNDDPNDGDPLYLLFSVEDTGRGLTEEEINHLFQRFSQASPKTHVQYGGSGLGLFICKTLSEKQGGGIGVASTSGIGSTFAFYVASKRAPHVEGEKSTTVLETSQYSHTPVNGFEQPVTLRKASVGASDTAAASMKTMMADPELRFPVLIVEDNVVNRKVLRKQLQKLCFPIHEACDGEEALRFLKTTDLWRDQDKGGQNLEIILMDVEMPVMDGLTCSREIRKLEAEGKLTSHIPIISVTANARQEQIDICIDAGMDDVVCKPFRIPELVAKMQTLRKRLGMTT